MRKSLLRELKMGRVYPTFLEQEIDLQLAPGYRPVFKFWHIQWVDYEEFGWGNQDRTRTLCGAIVENASNETWRMLLHVWYLEPVVPMNTMRCMGCRAELRRRMLRRNFARPGPREGVHRELLSVRQRVALDLIGVGL